MILTYHYSARRGHCHDQCGAHSGSPQKSAQSIPWQSSSALTAKSTGAKNAQNSSNLTNKVGKYMKTIIRDLCVRESYNSADSCSGTCIYWLLKGMVLNVVLKSTHESTSNKILLLRKPRPFGLSISRNLNLVLVIPLCVCVCACACVCVCVCVNIHWHARIHIIMFTGFSNTTTCVCEYTQACMRVHTHTHSS